MRYTDPIIADIVTILKKLHPGALRRILHNAERELERQTMGG